MTTEEHFKQNIFMMILVFFWTFDENISNGVPKTELYVSRESFWEKKILEKNKIKFFLEFERKKIAGVVKTDFCSAHPKEHFEGTLSQKVHLFVTFFGL